MVKNKGTFAGKGRWFGGVSSLALAMVLAAGAAPAHANPRGGTVVGGQAAISEAGNTVTVTQASDRAVINWDSFSIDADETTRFVQPSSKSIAANRVTGVDPSEILGTLQADGQVVLVNPNGVIFGKSAKVDAAGLIATTHDFKDDAFMAGGGSLRFDGSGNPDASVINEGAITIKEAGLAALVAPHVRNSGVIQADLGRVALASAKGFSVDLYGDGLLSFAPGDGLDATLGDGARALVENAGAIHANGGDVLLTAKSAEAVINASVNISGVVQATSVSSANGVIRLEGSGKVRVEKTAKLSASGAVGGGRITVKAGHFSSDGALEAEGFDTDGRARAGGGEITIAADSVGLGGRVSASGKSGGAIEVESESLLSLAGRNEAQGLMGAGGDVSYRADRIIESSTSVTDASGLTHGGAIRVEADNQIASSGDYRADGVYGRGGRIDITASDLRLLSSSLSVSGRLRGGLVRLGGAFQGGKTPDRSQDYYTSFVARWDALDALPSSTETFINDATIIDVSAWQGPGGTAVIWSDERTTFLGRIDARGAAGGGSVEISSAGDLRRAELTNVSIGDGHLLLDPKNIIIGEQETVQSWAYQGVLGVGYSGATENTHVRGLLDDRFGVTVSLNAAGDRLAVGAHNDGGADGATAGAGAAYLFSFTDANFSGGVLEATIGKGYTGGKNIDMAALDSTDHFGRAVALNGLGDRLAVGAYADDGAGAGSTTDNFGAVYLFTFSDANFGGGALAATIGKGYDIDPASDANDNFGLAVSLNAAGDRLAIGGNGDDGAADNVSAAGAVHLFTFADTSFSGGQLKGTIGRGYTGPNDINVALQESDSFGLSASLNAAGDRLAVGAWGDDGAGAGSTTDNFGAVYLFTFPNTDFESGAHAGTIGEGYGGVDIAAHLDVDDRLGYGVSLNAAGDRLAVGSLFDDGAGVGSNANNYGAVHLFTFADNSFTGGALAGTIGRGYTGGKNVTIPTLDVADSFGVSVALNGAGDRLAAGAQHDDGAGNADAASGAVHLFTFADTDFSTGAHVGTIGAGYTGVENVNVRLDDADAFGVSVALNGAGDRLAVGAFRDDGADNTTSDAGAAYLFSFTDASYSGAVLESIIGAGYTGGKNIDMALDADDLFGRSLSLNGAGDRLAVGAVSDKGAANGADAFGAVHLFAFTDTNFSGGILAGTIGRGYAAGKSIDVGTLEGGDQFGAAVSLNSDGSRLAVGAQYDDGFGNAVADSGAVYLFSFSDTGFSNGLLQSTIGSGYTGGKNLNFTLDIQDRFGEAVALNGVGDRLAVGSVWDDGAGNAVTNSGAAYLFSFTDMNFSGGQLQGAIGAGYAGVKDVDVALDVEDGLGVSLSLNAAGDRLAVASWNDGGAGNAISGAGAVHLFSFTDTNFSGGSREGVVGAGYTGEKDIDVALGANDRLGIGTSLNATGDRLAVGAYTDDGAGDGSSNTGAVYLFGFEDTDFTGGAQFGVMGADYHDGRDINVSSLSASDQFGVSASLNAAGDRLAVGSHRDDGFGDSLTDSGAVYLFSFTDGNFSCGALEGIIGKGYTGGKNVDVAALKESDLFGRAVSLNAAGDRLAVGAHGDDGDSPASTTDNYGAVYLFSFTDTNFSGGAAELVIGQGYTLNLASLDVGDTFGTSVALNAAGDRLAVGANGDDGSDDLASETGAVYLFNFPDNSYSGLTELAAIGSGYAGSKDINLALSNSDRFGINVSFNGTGDRLAVGAHLADGTIADTGAVFLFTFTDANFSGGAHAATIGSGFSGGKNISVALESTDWFGAGVALNAAGDRLAVGSHGDDGVGNAWANSGAVRIFTFADTSFSGGSLVSTIGRGYAGINDVNLTALEASDSFGIDVTFNGAGDRMAVGAHLDDGFGAGSTADNFGAVYLFSANAITGPRPLPVSYADFAGQTVTVSASDIAAVLAQGAAVTLQASNDITVAQPISVTDGLSVVGGLTLQAGRSLLIDADIATHGGDVTLIANDLLANGVIDAERDPGAAAIAMAPGVSIDAGAGAVAFELRDGAGKTNFGSGDITLGSITAGSITAVNAGLTAGSGIVLNTGAVLSASGTGDAITLAGQTFANNAGSAALDAANGRWLVWSEDPANDTRGGLAYDFKQYDAVYGATAPAQATGNGFLYEIAPIITGGLTGTVSKVYDSTVSASPTGVNYTVAGAVDGDVVTLNNPTSGVYDTKDAGSSKNVTVSGVSIASAMDGGAVVYGYQLASTTLNGAVGEITPATLTVSLAGDVVKTYDANTDASLTLSNYNLASAFAGDDVNLAGFASGAYDTKNVGVGKTVTVNGLSLTGADAGNYQLSATSLSAGIGTIDPAALTASLTGDVAKTYDANTDATLLSGNYILSGVLGTDGVELANFAAGTYDDKNVGSGKLVTVTGLTLTGSDADGDGFNDAGNYILASDTVAAAIGVIDPATLSASLTGDVIKTYDAAADATLGLSNYNLAGVLASDDIALGNFTAGSYDDKNVGTGKTVSVSGLALTGADAGNYQLASTSVSGAVGTINKASVSVDLIDLVTKVYDADTDATLSAANYLVTGLYGSDDVALNNPAAGTYDDKNVGTGKLVTVSGLALSGADAANYQLDSTSVSGAVGEITPAMLTVDLVNTVARTYNAGTDATLTAANYDLSGVFALDDVILNNPALGVYDDKNVGTGKTVTVNGLSLAGTDAGNYQLASTSVSGAIGEITPAMLTVDLVNAVAKTYNANTDATLSPENYNLIGWFAPDDIALNNPTAGTYDDKNVGTGKTVTVNGLSLSGADATNYQLASTSVSGDVGEITHATLTVELVGSVAKVYNANTGASLTGANYSLQGVFGSDDVVLNNPVAGNYNDKNVGTGKTVIVSGLALSGADAGNYVLASTSASENIGEITPATLTAGLTGSVAKVYDGAAAASLAAGNYSLSGVLGSDSVSLNNPTLGSYADKNVGTGKLVTAGGLSLSGADAGNYVLASTNVSAAIGEIDHAMVTVDFAGAVSRAYDGTTMATLGSGDFTTAGFIAGDDIALAYPASGTYDDKNVGAGKTVTISGLALSGADAGNYQLAATTVSDMVGEITPALVTADLVGAVSKIYDRTTAAPLASSDFAVAGFITGDDVALSYPISGRYGDKNAGSGKIVTVTGLALEGADAGNYQLVSTTASNAAGEITPATLTADLVGAVSKVYDGTDAAALSLGGYTLAGLLAGDEVTLSASGTYDSKNVGAGKTVTFSNLSLAGADAANYALSAAQIQGAVGEITPAALIVQIEDALRRRNQPNPVFAYTISGFFPGEDESLVSGLTVTTTAEIDSPVGVYPIMGDGASAANYVFFYENGTLTVLPELAPADPDVRTIVFTDQSNVEYATELFGCAALASAAPQLSAAGQFDSSSCLNGALNISVKGFPATVGMMFEEAFKR